MHVDTHIYTYIYVHIPIRPNNSNGIVLVPSPPAERAIRCKQNTFTHNYTYTHRHIYMYAYICMHRYAYTNIHMYIHMHFTIRPSDSNCTPLPPNPPAEQAICWRRISQDRVAVCCRCALPRLCYAFAFVSGPPMLKTTQRAAWFVGLVRHVGLVSGFKIWIVYLWLVLDDALPMRTATIRPSHGATLKTTRPSVCCVSVWVGGRGGGSECHEAQPVMCICVCVCVCVSVSMYMFMCVYVCVYVCERETKRMRMRERERERQRVPLFILMDPCHLHPWRKRRDALPMMWV